MSDLDRAAELAEWARSNPEVKRAISAFVARFGFSSLGELASSDPASFDLIYDSMHEMLEQLPWT